MVFLFQTTKEKYESVAVRAARAKAANNPLPENKKADGFTIPAKKPELDAKAVPVKIENLRFSDMTMLEAVKKASELGGIIRSNIKVDTLINGELAKKAFPPFLTGTLVAYGTPGKPLGKTIKCGDLTLAVPLEWQGMKDVAIVCEHPNFTIDDNGTIKLNKAEVVSFPAKDGWRMPDKYGIPNGVPVSGDEGQENAKYASKENNYIDTRYLLRDKNNYIGLLARGCQKFDPDNRKKVYAIHNQAARFEVLIDGASIVPAKTPVVLVKSDPVKPVEIVKSKYTVWRNMTFQEAVEKAFKLGVRILSNSEIDVLLQSGKKMTKVERLAIPCWTGTFVAYAPPGEKLGKTIKFSNLMLEVPQEFQGKKDVAIVCVHSDLQLNGNTITIKPGKAELAPIPAKEGWYVLDEQGIPNGKASVESDKNARFLFRQYESYIGLLARGSFFGNDRGGVYASYRPSYRFGVFVSTEDEKVDTTAQKTK